MSPNTLLILQSVGITAHMVNAGLAGITDNATVTLIVSAVVGGFQYYLQNAGNRMEPK